MTFFNTLYFLNDEISSFSFFLFESPPPSYPYYYPGADKKYALSSL